MTAVRTPGICLRKLTESETNRVTRDRNGGNSRRKTGLIFDFSLLSCERYKCGLKGRRPLSVCLGVKHTTTGETIVLLNERMSMTLGTKAKGEPIAIKGRCSMTSLVAVGLMGVSPALSWRPRGQLGNFSKNEHRTFD